jgi:hypothetical protein
MREADSQARQREGQRRPAAENQNHTNTTPGRCGNRPPRVVGGPDPTSRQAIVMTMGVSSVDGGGTWESAPTLEPGITVMTNAWRAGCSAARGYGFAG